MKNTVSCIQLEKNTTIRYYNKRIINTIHTVIQKKLLARRDTLELIDGNGRNDKSFWEKEWNETSEQSYM